MAAHIEGKGCATMNQTGLAQKFGAVVSHVRIGRRQRDIQAVRIAALGTITARPTDVRVTVNSAENDT